MHYYIHIPFCVSRCAYCDFFSTTSLERRTEYVTALVREIGIRRNGTADTVYFGGGTPSVLEPDAIRCIIEAIGPIDTSAEITLEANPGDLTEYKLRLLRQVGVNRLSIGVQSFDDTLLRRIDRRHNGQQALYAIRDAQTAGFDNISIDLMYGLPGQDMTTWQKDIETALQLGIQHLSCYCLSYEQGTRLTLQLERGEVKELDEDTLNDMYDRLCEQTEQAGYEHYEVSNFALPSFRSRHNSSYWTDEPYIGVGAGAHSYDNERRIRSWNVSDLDKYISAISRGERPYEQELVTNEQHRMEQIMLGLRTNQGIKKELVANNAHLKDYLSRGMIIDTGTHYVVTRHGIRLLNRIVEHLV